MVNGLTIIRKQESALHLFVSIALVRIKSSGIFLIFEGQYVGLPVKMYFKLLLFKALYSFLPLVVVILEPHAVFIALKSS